MQYANIVFLGPSLPLQAAKNILPNALFLPPVRCGDILRALRLEPQLIAIIDGFFEHTAAVWHKEILFAIERGISIYGASSMGALRAAELAKFGMQGIGKIYEDYAQEILIDDDEVAVLHQTKQNNFAALSEAMVNIRATLNHAQRKNVIDGAIAQVILQHAKQLFYTRRSLKNACQNALQEGISSHIIDTLLSWVNEGGYVDQKKLDAIKLLKHVAKLTSSSTNPKKIHSKQKTVATNHSTFLRTLNKSINCRPFSSFQKNLPITEQVVFAARWLGSTYRLLRRFAYLLAAADALAIAKNIADTPSQFENDIFDLETIKQKNWAKLNDCSEHEHQKIIKRLQQLQQLLAQENTPEIPSKELYFLSLMRLANDYAKHKQHTDYQSEFSQASLQKIYQQTYPLKYRTLEMMAALWQIIDWQAERLGLVPQVPLLQMQSDKFRHNHDLLTQELTQEWIEANDLDMMGYQQLMILSTRLNFLVLQNNLDVIGAFATCNVDFWLLEALRISGTYEVAKTLLYDKEKRQQALQNLKEELPENAHEFAFTLDYQSLEELMADILTGGEQTLAG